MAGRWGSERQKANGASASTGLLHTVIEASLSQQANITVAKFFFAAFTSVTHLS